VIATADSFVDESRPDRIVDFERQVSLRARRSSSIASHVSQTPGVDDPPGWPPPLRPVAVAPAPVLLTIPIGAKEKPNRSLLLRAGTDIRARELAVG